MFGVMTCNINHIRFADLTPSRQNELSEVQNSNADIIAMAVFIHIANIPHLVAKCLRSFVIFGLIHDFLASCIMKCFTFFFLP